MHVQVHGQTQLGADAVCAGNQYRLAVAFGNFTQGAETTQAAHYFRTRGALGNVLDTVDQGVTGGDVHTGVFVADRGFGRRLAAHERISNCEKKDRSRHALVAVRAGAFE